MYLRRLLHGESAQTGGLVRILGSINSNLVLKLRPYFSPAVCVLVLGQDPACRGDKEGEGVTASSDMGQITRVGLEVGRMARIVWSNHTVEVFSFHGLTYSIPSSGTLGM